jgi:hypothetical protein
MQDSDGASSFFLSVGNFIQVILVAAITSGATAWFTYRTEDRKIEFETLKIAVDVLRAPVDASGGVDMRRWAWLTIQEYSGVKIPSGDSPVREQAIIGTVVQDDNPITPRKSVDVDVFVCEQLLANNQSAADLAEMLRPSFGRLRIKKWTDFSQITMQQLKGATTIIVDDGDGEAAYVPKLQEVISGMSGLPPPKLISNVSAKTPWYLSVIVCN